MRTDGTVCLRHVAPFAAVLGLLGPGQAVAADFGPDVPPPSAMLAPDPAPAAASHARKPVPAAAPAAPVSARTPVPQAPTVTSPPAAPVRSVAAPTYVVSPRASATPQARPQVRPQARTKPRPHARRRVAPPPVEPVEHPLRPEPAAPQLLPAASVRRLGAERGSGAALAALLALAALAAVSGVGTAALWRRAAGATG